jgi:4,5-dihydroxyphthalate decarboxylase
MNQRILRTAIGKYSHTAALRSGAVASDLLRLEFAEVPVISRAFAPMVREGRYDVCEMAIGTFLQAKAYGKPLVLLPLTIAGRFQEGALVCRADTDLRSPADLKGKRIGVRAYSQTTGIWLRGILADMHGVRPETVRWVTFEDAHVAEYRDPPWAERAMPGQDMLAMLRQGELDAAIFGNELPKDDPSLRPVFRDPTAAAEAFWQAHGFVPVNHLVAVTRDLALGEPALLAELMRMLAASRAAGPASVGERDALPVGRTALQPAMALLSRYTWEQGLLPRALDVGEIWEGLPPA